MSCCSRARGVTETNENCAITTDIDANPKPGEYLLGPRFLAYCQQYDGTEGGSFAGPVGQDEYWGISEH
jgi:hypothetical protein